MKLRNYMNKLAAQKKQPESVKFLHLCLGEINQKAKRGEFSTSLQHDFRTVEANVARVLEREYGFSVQRKAGKPGIIIDWR